jgi:hypothetical protein
MALHRIITTRPRMVRTMDGNWGLLLEARRKPHDEVVVQLPRAYLHWSSLGCAL